MRRHFRDIHSDEFTTDERYNMAFKQMKRIKGFYVHLLVYILINAFILFGNRYEHGNGEFWRWETFSTAIFWGIGLAAHGLSVFGRNIFFTSDWENRKIQEFMDKDKSQKWQ